MPSAPVRELRRLRQSVSFHLSERGVGGVVAEAADVAKSYATYPFLKARWEREPLHFQGRQIPYFRHHYNRAWRNERSVELALAREFMAQTSGRTLEVGNVLSHYGPVDHDILDKYEESPGVMNDDIVDFAPAVPYERIISISTLEHVGWDEHPREADKTLRAYQALRRALAPGGTMLLTCPVGQNAYLDEYLQEEALDFPVRVFLRRISSDNRWVEVGKDEVRGAVYGSPYRNANALFVGVVPGAEHPWPS
jgi:hypothetical protein